MEPIKVVKSFLCVLSGFLKAKLVCLLDGRKVFKRLPGYFGSLALWKYPKTQPKNMQNTTHVHCIYEVRKELTSIKYFNAIETEIMTI